MATPYEDVEFLNYLLRSSGLTEKQAEVISRVDLDGDQLADVAKDRGVTAEAIRYLRAGALRKMQMRAYVALTAPSDNPPPRKDSRLVTCNECRAVAEVDVASPWRFLDCPSGRKRCPLSLPGR